MQQKLHKEIHRAEERGVAEHGWLHSRFSFSFADWYNPERMGFGVLRVLNDDIVEPNSGFGMHPHSNMEIITLVTEGVVTHSDSMGNRYEVPAGDVQVMSAGTGVVHAEENKSADVPLKLFQIWIEPKEENIAPRYEQVSFKEKNINNELELLVAPLNSGHMPSINQDAYMYRWVFDAGASVAYAPKGEGRGVYIFVVEGSVQVLSDTLNTRDAVGVSGAAKIDILSINPSTILLFDVPMR